MKKKAIQIIFSVFLLFFILSSVSLVFAGPKQLRVAVNTNMAPYQFIGEDGECVGLHIDILNWIAQRKGLELFYVPYEKSHECLKALSNGEVDIVLGHKSYDTVGYEFQLTGELSRSSICMVAPKELVNELNERADYKSLSAALEYGTLDYTHMNNLGLRKYVSYGNQQMVVDALISGEVDIAFGIKECFDYLFAQKGIADNYTILRNYLSPISYSMLVREDDEELFTDLDTGLTELRTSGKYESIYRNWIVDRDLIKAQQRQQLITRLLGIAAVGTSLALLVMAFNVRMNILLKRKVDEKTKELRDANTQLERMVEQLHSEGRLRNSIIEDSPNAMIFIDSTYCITLANSAARNMAGVEELVGKNIKSVGVFSEILGQIRYDIFSAQEDSVDKPMIVEIGQDETKQSYRCIFYRSSDYSTIEGMLMTVENVTAEELKKQERFEAEKNKALNRLVAGIAHEIKNPLMAIKTACTLILNQGDDPEIKNAFADFVPYEIERINQLVEGLISYARPTKDKTELFDLSKLVNDCLYLTSIAAKRSRICLETEIEDNLYISAKKVQIKQSLINIIINGIESMEKKLAGSAKPDGSIKMKITAYKNDKNAIVVVRDEGVGMTAEEIKQCTKPFFSTKPAGTGLGLAIVKQYIQENNGILHIKSEKNKYTEITLTFRRYDLSEKQDSNH
ncbi:MAG: transporter substrate-binding domain-containing protein [Tepidanaerobacteraceae bacterium]|jgi:polar amino acid transport system substrate-binding protein|nr:transporter substrate-binding domain-containing protein [Tepidanaerobacteraceae bacterium]HQE05095.1 transporter substrate-binding domain-containing protein [Tepidanaerobacteraceae bacterium]